MSQSNSVSAPLGVVALVLLLVGGFALLPRVFARAEVKLDDKTAPAAADLTFRMMMNQDQLSPASDSVALSAFRGKPVILDFWASWCKPCQEETPIVNKVYERFKDRGLMVIGVNTGDQESSGRAWAQNHGIEFPIASDADESASRAFEVTGLPTLVIISKTGKVLTMRAGITDESELESLVGQVL